MRFTIFLPIVVLVCGLVGCGNSPSDKAAAEPVETGPALRSPVVDADLLRAWADGAAEVSTYSTERLRGGSLRKGSATAIARRVEFSEDDRVAEPADGNKSAARDLFPALQLNWIENYTRGAETCEEATTSVVSLSAVEGRPAGTETKADFSARSWDGQMFHQLLFDATGIRSHQYTFEKEGDEQITVSYPRDGVSADALWFWARSMAAPLVGAGQQRVVELLPRLRDVREEHQPLSWRKATLTRSAADATGEQFRVQWEGGRTEIFVVGKAAPFRVMHWENSDGERADLISSNRLKNWDVSTPSHKESLQ